MKKKIFLSGFLLTIFLTTFTFFMFPVQAQWTPANFWKQVGDTIQLWNSNLELTVEDITINGTCTGSGCGGGVSVTLPHTEMLVGDGSNNAVANSSITVADTGDVTATDDMKAESFTVDTSTVQANVEGRIKYDDVSGGLVVDTDDSSVSAKLHEGTFKIKNTTGGIITALTVVYPTGSTGGNPTVELADADFFEKSIPVGLIASDSISDNGVGYVVTDGKICGKDTSMYAEGAGLYVSKTPGELSTTIPPFPARPVFVGVVTISHASDGCVIVDSSPGYNLDQSLKVGDSPEFDGANFTNIESGEVNLNTLSGVERTLAQYMNTIQGSGYVTGGDFADNGDGTLSVSAGAGFIKSSDVLGADSFGITWSANTSMSLVADATNYVYIDYNSGTPIVAISTTNSPDFRTVIHLGKVYKNGSGVLHLFKAGAYVAESSSENIKRWVAQYGEETLTSGGVVAETGERYLTVSAATLYGGIVKSTTSAVDTSGVDTFHYYYTDGIGGWNDLSTAASQINNTQYDNGGTLTNLGNNRYRTDCAYLDHDGHISVILGTNNELTLFGAKEEPCPFSPPDIVAHFATVIAKIIVQEGGTNLTEVDNLETGTTFSSGGAVVHNETTGIQGGTADEYYHLNAAQSTQIIDWVANGIDISDDTNLTAGDYITLTDDDLNIDIELANKIFSIPISSPATTDSGIIQHKFAGDVTINRISCSSDVGTFTVQFDERAEGTPNTAGTDVMTAVLVCDSTTEATTSFDNAGISADAIFNLDIDAVASDPTKGRIHVEYTIND